MTNKMTKKDMFAQVIALANGEAIAVTPAEIVAFAEHEIELLTKKSSTGAKPTKTQLENEVHKASILAILGKHDEPMTISDIMEDELLTGLTNQRVSALMTQLKNAGQVVRTEFKKKAYFALAE